MRFGKVKLNLPSWTNIRTETRDKLNSVFLEYGRDAYVPRGPLYGFANMLAALRFQLTRFARNLVSQVVLWGQTGDNLRRSLEFFDVEIPDATKATVEIAVEGSNNAVIPVGHPWTRQGDSLQYVVTTEVIYGVGTSTVSVFVEAVEAGRVYNTEAGTAFLIGEFIANVATGGSAITTTVPGADAPTDEELQELLRARVSQSIGAGTVPDYERLVRERVNNIRLLFIEHATNIIATNSFVFNPKGYGPGTVTIYIILENPPATPDKVLTFLSSIELNALVLDLNSKDIRRTNDRVLVVNLVPALVDFTIGLDPNSGDAQVAVEVAITALLVANYQPGPYTITLEDINSAINAVSGLLGFNVEDIAVDGNSIGATDVDAGRFRVLTPGLFDWQDIT